MGPKQWAAVAQHLQGRTGKQCRERCDVFLVTLILNQSVCLRSWHNNLDPNVNKRPWTPQEEQFVIFFHC